MIEFVATLFENRRWLVGGFMLHLTLLAVAGHLSLFRHASPTHPDPGSVDAKKRESEFLPPKPDAYLVVDVADLRDFKTIAAIRDMVKTLSEMESVSDVKWIESVPVLTGLGIPRSIFPHRSPAAEAMNESIIRLQAHPLIRGQLISDDLKTLLMPIRITKLSSQSLEACTQGILKQAREAVRRHGMANQIQVRLTGPVPLFVETSKALTQNQIKFQIIGYSLAFVITVFLFRGILPVFVVGAVPAVAIFWTTGLLKLIGEQTNLLTDVIMPVLIAMVGLTDGVHLMMHIRKRRAAGSSQISAAADAIRVIGLACGLTSLTTAIGFGSLMLSESPFIQGFGRACMIGVSVSFVAVITVIPMITSSRWGKNIHRGHEHDLIGRNLHGCVGLLNWIIARPRLVSGLAIIMTVGLAIPALTLRPDNKIKNALPSDSEIYDAMVHCDEAFGGIDFAYIVMSWPENASDAEVCDFVSEVQSAVRSESLLRYPLSIANFLSAFPGSQPDAVKLKTVLAVLPDDLERMFFLRDQRKTVMTVRMADTGIAQYRPVFQNLEQEFTRLTERHPGFAVSFSGLTYNRAKELYAVVTDLAKSLGAAAAIIFVVLTLVYRSLRIGLISIIPNMFPLVVTATVLRTTGGTLDFASACAFTVCLGIAVDDTIHFLTRFRQERSKTDDQVEAVRNTFIGVGTALITTTVILVVGFSTALTSNLPDHRMFAAMACATISSALLGDLFFLPALLLHFGPEKNRRSVK